MSNYDDPTRILIPWPTEQGPLPHDCLMCICEYLEPKDLIRFALACREFYHVARTGSLWRMHCLNRWVVCGLIRVPEGNDRWRRYFMYRSRVESGMTRGEPRDFYSLSLRGHDTEITKMMYMKSIDINYDGLLPLNLVSYDRDGVIIAWDVSHQGNKGDYIWRGKTCKRRAGMATTEDAGVVVYPSPSGDTVIFTSTQNWRDKKRPDLKLPPMISPSGCKVLVTFLMYAELHGKLPKPFLIVARGGDTECSRIEIWDPENESAEKPIVMLDTVGLVPTILKLSSNHILAASGDREYKESCSPYVKIWDLTLLPVDGSLVKEHIVIQSRRDVMNIHWWNGRRGVLAVGATGESGLAIWHLQPYLDQLRSSAKEAKKSQFSIQQKTVSLTYTNANYTVSDFHCSENLFPMASTRFYLLFGGSYTGQLCMLPVEDNKHVLIDVKHTGIITGVAATEFGVFTCSRDFSMRVSKWRRGKTPDDPPLLDSLYTLLGGTVIHDAYGFHGIYEGYNVVSGISGERIKIYLFQG